MDLSCPLRRVREGLVDILVPDMEYYRRPDGVYEPAWAPVFYNPRMVFNRDVAVLFARTYRRVKGMKELVVVEPLTGTGVRAVRYAVETGAERVYACDIDELAYRLALRNVELNHVKDKVTVERSDANEFMYRLRVEGVKAHLVDVDPFGSPAPFLEAALDLLRGRGVLALTATDTAPLAGVYPHALRKKYDVMPGRCYWDKEQAVRILLGYVIRRAASRDYAVRVLLAYYADHYVRAYVELERGARRALEVLDKYLGYAACCPACGFTAWGWELFTRCPYCQHPLVVVGPMYTGPLGDPDFVHEMRRELSTVSWLCEHGRVQRLLELLECEYRIVKPYYRVDKLCSYLGKNMPKLSELVEELKRSGYQACRTHFEAQGVRTDAPHSVIMSLLSTQ